MKKYFNILLILLFVILEIFLLSKSQIVINSFRKTLNICLYNLMPTMFFSIIISSILIKLNISNYIPKFIINIFKKLFNINKNEVIIFILSILSGYPNNSKMLINNINLNNIIQYTNFVNPIFLICTVGGIYLNNIKLSLIILFSHYLSNFLLGIILRKKNKSNNINDINNNDINVLYEYNIVLKDTIYTLSSIFSNMLFFSIIISLFNNIFKFNILFNSIIIGLIEFSSGIYNICNIDISLFLKGLLILIIITFGSFSIHMQIICLNDKIKYIKYLLYRILNVFICTLIYIILYKLYY